MQKCTLALGCFWKPEENYKSKPGILATEVGYAGGDSGQTSYKDVCTGKTGHAEAVEVIYNAQEIRFSDLVDVYFGSQNIGQVNGQGPDRGLQYRSIIFYQNQIQKDIIDNKIKELEQTLGKGKVAAEVLPFEKFWEGESYHQNYERLNPSNPYIQNVSIPRLKKFQKKFPDLLKTKIH